MVRLRESDTPPAWWKVAHALLVIADECSSGIGYTLSNESLTSGPSEGSYYWANAVAYNFAQNARAADHIDSQDDLTDDRHRRQHVGADTLDYVIDPLTVRVLPKGRTTEFGCSIRTLSHNLTLLPSRGFTDAYWHQPVANFGNNKTKLNLLLLPFPFHIPAGSFRGRENRNRAGDSNRWGRFRIDQKWLRTRPSQGADSGPEMRRNFVAFVDALLMEARAARRPVNGIVLPEYSLDWLTYDALVRHVRDRYPQIEFVVSGVSRDCNGLDGNFVVVSTIYEDDAGRRIAATHSRRKHHRWQLDGAQIRTYGLQRDLSPRCVWWEYLEIGQRIVHIDVFRNKSALTAVICEDLARVDPALSLIRSLGPNLVFALLMDGPQLAGRWPGSYAGSLSDDPGSSVMTLTCAALVDRSNATRKKSGKRPGKRSIALWRHHLRMGSGTPSDQGIHEISLGPGKHAVLMQLDSKPAPETTIDGRANSDTTAWYYRSQLQLRVPRRDIRRNGWEWIVEGVS